MTSRLRGSARSALIAGALLYSAAAPALAADKFKVTEVECESFFLFKHTPVLHYDIVGERLADYQAGPGADYFRQAAERTAAYCDRTSARTQQPLGPPRQIRGVWFQSNDGQFKALYDLQSGGLDALAGVVNRIGDRRLAEQRAAARQSAQLEEIRTRDARERELRAAQDEAARIKAAADRKAAEEKDAAGNAREALFFGDTGLQVARLGAAVSPANFALIEDVRTNPFHYRKLGLAVVRLQFNRMVTDKVALFGNELAPVLIHMEDVDRFTRSGETVMLAFRVIERGDAERSYGSLPEIILSAMKAEPIFGDYVGAYPCPADDCQHVFDAPPRT